MDNRTTIGNKMPNVDQKSLMSKLMIATTGNNANRIIIEPRNHNNVISNINNRKESSSSLTSSSSSFIAHKSSDCPRTTTTTTTTTTTASTLDSTNSAAITTATLVATTPNAVSSKNNNDSSMNAAIPIITNVVNDPIKKVKDLNEFISCHLCKGYLIDATTIIECLHSFCRTCIIKYFDDETNPRCHSCPKCDTQVHKTKPKLNIRSDPTLQDIVYKLVPGLFKNEMSRRKEFYARFPEKAVGLSNEEKGEINGERLILSHDDIIQITIEYFPEVSNPFKLLPFNNDENFRIKLNNLNQRRYLLCKVGMKVLHLKKFIRSKYELDNTVMVDFFYKHELLKDDYTIMDLAYIYSWRRNMPMSLYYLILEPNKTLEDYLVFLPQSKLPPFSQNRRSYRQTRLMMKKLHDSSHLMRSRSSSLVLKKENKTNNDNGKTPKVIIKMSSKKKSSSSVNSSLSLAVSSTSTPITTSASKATATIMANSLTPIITYKSMVEASSRITNGFKRSSEKTELSSNLVTNKKAKIQDSVISDNKHDSNSIHSSSSNNMNGPSSEDKNDKTVSEVKFLTNLAMISEKEKPLDKTLSSSISKKQAPENAESVANEFNVNKSSESKSNENLDPSIKQDSSNSTDLFLNIILREVEEKVLQMNGLSNGETQHITNITGIEKEKKESTSLKKSTTIFKLDCDSKNHKETANNGVLSSDGLPSNDSLKNENDKNVIMTPDAINKNPEPKMQNGAPLADTSLHINGTSKNERIVAEESLLKKTNDEIKSTMKSLENDTNVNNHHNNSSGTDMDKPKNNLKPNDLLETFLKGDLNGGDGGPKNFQNFQKLLYSKISNNNCNKIGTDPINQTIDSIKNNDNNHGNNVQLHNHNHNSLESSITNFK